MKTRSSLAALAVVCTLALGLLPACSQKKETPATIKPNKHEHHHHPPHGGTAVVLGDEAFHLELVLDQAAGKLSAYVLDGELENFIRISQAAIEIEATVAGAKQVLVLTPVANAATGELVGDTSLFETKAEWLKTVREFDASVVAVTVRGITFREVKFNFPKGNDKD